MPLIDLAPALTRRLLAGAVVCALVLPAPAFSQGAGDDQYRDPFPEATAQDSQSGDTPTETTSDGLSDTPPTSGSSSGASTDTDASSAGTESAGSSGAESSATPAPSLAQTGDDPWLVALAGGSLLLLGVGLRLRGGAQHRH
jgi:hypothetical protein